MLSGIAALELLSVHTDRVAVWIAEAEVKSNGLMPTLLMNGRQPAREGREVASGSRRFGVQFSDGQKATVYGISVFTRQAVADCLQASIPIPHRPSDAIGRRDDGC